MVQDYYRERALRDALIGVLNTFLPSGFTAVGPFDGEFAVGTCVVNVLPPTPQFTRIMAGPDHAVSDVQYTCIGSSRENASNFGSVVRQIVSERDRLGALAHPIVWETGRVDDVAEPSGFLATEGGANSWVETNRVFYQAH